MNLINNPSFETNTTSWLMHGSTNRSAFPLNETYNNILGNYSIKIDGDGSSTYYISQDINVNGNSGDSFVFGGWSKGDTQPQNYQSNKYYRMSITLNEFSYGYTYEYQCYYQSCGYYPVQIKEYEPKTYYLDFNSNINEWQYLMNSIKASKSYDKITIKVEYMGEGTVYFDGIQLYKEDFGTSYNYYGQEDPIVAVDNPVDVARDGKVETVNYPGEKEDTSITYNNSGDIESVTDASGDVTHMTYIGRKIDTVIQNNVKVDFNYVYNNDYNYDLESVTTGDNSLYFSTSTKYAYHGQFTSSSTDQYGNTVDYDYDPVTGLLESLKNKNSDLIDVVTNYRYDAYGRLIKIEKDSSSNEYIYSEGKLKRILVNGYYYEFIYDDFNRIKNVLINTTELMSYDYYLNGQNGSNQIHNQYYGNGDKIEFIYDSEDRIQDINFNETKRFHYEYDYASRLSRYFDYVNGDTFTYKYDLSGRLKTITDQNNNTISLGYNENDGKLKDYDYTIDGKTVYEDFYYYTTGSFKGMYGQTKITIDDQIIIKDYHYDEDSLKRLKEIVLTIDNLTVHQNFDYDNDSVVQGNASTRIKTLSYDLGDLSYTYTYDNLGNIKEVIVKENNVEVEKYQFKYDDLNQLIRENIHTSKIEFTKVYEYDGNGNILYIKEYGYIEGDLDDAPTSTIRYYYSDDWKDQVTKIAKVKNEDTNTIVEVINEFIDYDNLGNPTKIVNFKYHNQIYNHAKLDYEGRELKSIFIYNSEQETESTLVVTISFKYNDQGIRTEKQITENGNTVKTEYFVNGNKVLYETNGTDKIYYLYDVDDKLIGFNYNNRNYLYIRNLQNDITKIVDEEGRVIVEYTYSAWGIFDSKEYKYNDENVKIEVIELNIAKINPYGYRGYRYDVETSLYYLNSRYYNPEIGRFINADGLIGQTGDILGHNMYAYAENNPVMMVDPSGYMPTWMKVAFVAVAVVAVVTAAVILAPAVVAAASTLAVTGSGALALGAGGTAITSGGAAIAIGALGIGYLSASIAVTDGAIIDDAIPRTNVKEKSYNDTVIYRWGSGSNTNLTPRQKDVTGLSYSLTPPVSGSYTTTTIGAINSTGLLTAVIDGPNHVSVRAVNPIDMYG